MSHHPHSQASDAAHHTTDNSEVNVYPAYPLRDSTHRDGIASRPSPTSRARGGLRSRRPVGNRSISLLATVRNSSRDNRDASQRNQLHSHDANPNLYNRPRAGMSSEVDPPSQRGGISQYSVDCSQDSASNMNSQENGSTIPKAPLNGPATLFNGAKNFTVNGVYYADGEDFPNRDSACKDMVAIDQLGSIVPPRGIPMPRQGHPHIPGIGTQHTSNRISKSDGEKMFKRARSPDGEHETYAEERQRKIPCTSARTTELAYTSPETPCQFCSMPDTSNSISNHPPDVDSSDEDDNTPSPAYKSKSSSATNTILGITSVTAVTQRGHSGSFNDLQNPPQSYRNSANEAEIARNLSPARTESQKVSATNVTLESRPTSTDAQDKLSDVVSTIHNETDKSRCSKSARYEADNTTSSGYRVNSTKVYHRARGVVINNSVFTSINLNHGVNSSAPVHSQSRNQFLTHGMHPFAPNAFSPRGEESNDSAAMNNDTPTNEERGPQSSSSQTTTDRPSRINPDPQEVGLYNFRLDNVAMTFVNGTPYYKKIQ